MDEECLESRLAKFWFHLWWMHTRLKQTSKYQTKYVQFLILLQKRIHDAQRDILAVSSQVLLCIFLNRKIQGKICHIAKYRIQLLVDSNHWFSLSATFSLNSDFYKIYLSSISSWNMVLGILYLFNFLKKLNESNISAIFIRYIEFCLILL